MMKNKILRNLWLVLYSLFCKTKCAYKGPNGKTVKILANGPSLKDDLSNLIETDSTCVLNFFCMDNFFWQIKPQHYVLVDPGFFMEENISSNVERLYETINRIDWHITFYVPLRYYSVFRSKVKNNKYIFIKTFYRFPLLDIHKCTSLDVYMFKKGIHAPSAQNVLIPSIFMMLNEGYEKTFLYGTDHSWISQMEVNDKNQVCLVDKHFYDVKEPTLRPWYNGSGNIFKMHELMKIFYTIFLAYHNLEAYTKFLRNAKIYNMTKSSFIDAFKKI